MVFTLLKYPVFPYQGNQATSKSKEDKRNLAPAIKEKVPGGSTHEELFTEVEKQYVVVTAPKVSPKPKKPVKDGSSSKVEGGIGNQVFIWMEGSLNIPHEQSRL